MKPSLEADRVYLDHMLECIARVEEYAGGDELRFRSSRLVQDAIIRNLQTLAESSQRLSAVNKQRSKCRGARFRAFGTSSCMTISASTSTPSGRWSRRNSRHYALRCCDSRLGCRPWVRNGTNRNAGCQARRPGTPGSCA